MDSLPPYLQNDVEKYLREKRLKDLDIFKYLPDKIVGKIALKLTTKSCGANKYLTRKNEIGNTLYIQRTGESATEDGKIKYCRGDVIGEDVILSRKRLSTVVCTMYSEFYVLDIADILNTLKAHYTFKKVKKHWSKICKIIAASTKRLQHPRRSITMLDIEYLPHRHVDLETIRDLEGPYIPKIAKDDDDLERDYSHRSNLSQTELDMERDRVKTSYELYEDELLKEEENEKKNERVEHQHHEEHKKLHYIMGIFQDRMVREESQLRDEKIRRNHTKRFDKTKDKYTFNETPRDPLRKTKSITEDLLDDDETSGDDLDELEDVWLEGGIELSNRVERKKVIMKNFLTPAQTPAQTPMHTPTIALMKRYPSDKSEDEKKHNKMMKNLSIYTKCWNESQCRLSFNVIIASNVSGFVFDVFVALLI